MLLLRFVSDLDWDSGLCGSAVGIFLLSAPSVLRAEGAVPAVGVKTQVLRESRPAAPPPLLRRCSLLSGLLGCPEKSKNNDKAKDELKLAA